MLSTKEVDFEEFKDNFSKGKYEIQIKSGESHNIIMRDMFGASPFIKYSIIFWISLSFIVYLASIVFLFINYKVSIILFIIGMFNTITIDLFCKKNIYKNLLKYSFYWEGSYKKEINKDNIIIIDKKTKEKIIPKEQY